MQKADYILIKQVGRGCWRAVYHELANDGTNPRCGTRINQEQWHLMVRAPHATTRRCCKRCQRLQETT